MSGGHFDYLCFKFNELADRLKYEIDHNKKKDDFGYSPNYSTETIQRLKKCYKLIKKIGDIAYSIEWLYSGDISEETFNKEYDKLFGGKECSKCTGI